METERAPQSKDGLIPTWLRGYRGEWLRLDVLAGLTSAAVVIPKAMAYATIAGLPVQAGLYTAFLPLVVYAILGTSRVLSVTTTTTLAILAATALGEAVPGGGAAPLLAASATLALLVGGLLLLASALKLGFVANFISEPVLIGFKSGIGLVIVLDQLPKLLGVHFAKGGFFHNFLHTLAAVPESHVPTLVLGVVLVLILVVIEHRFPKWPAPLIAAGLAIGAIAAGMGAMGVKTVGSVPTGLPPLTLPNLGLLEVLWPAALGIALMSFSETIAAGRAFIANDEPAPAPNRELMATGLANVAGAFLGSMPAGGGTTQTAVNRLAGAKTQVSGLVLAAVSLVTMLLLAPAIALLPDAALAAIVLVYSVGLIKPAEFKALLRIRRMEFAWALSAMVGVALLGTLKGILVAIVISLVGLAHQAYDPPVHALGRKKGTGFFRPLSPDHPDDETFPGLLIVRVEGRIFFANAARVGEKFRELMRTTQPRVVALDCRSVFDLEYTALKILTEGERRLGEHGIELWLVAMNPSVLDMVRRSPLGEALGKHRMVDRLEVAVERFMERDGEKGKGEEHERDK